jgi:dihydropteroate synthase
VKAGADIVNDVSGGTFDENMLETVGELGVPIIIMHMRGTPETMDSLTKYNDVVSDVATTLLHQSTVAEKEHGVHRWMQVVDPGIGFAKDLRGNLLLLQNVARIRSTVGNLPMLIGTSRKGFIGMISGVREADGRDAGTIASCVAALCLEDQPDADNQRCSILRVHNVPECKQAAMVMDSIRNARP